MLRFFRHLSILLVCFLLLTPQRTVAGPLVADTCTTMKMQVERLPDLNVPRIGHQVFSVGGEVVVAGGHTSGFIPTQTAEYYSDGEWHLVPTVYTHDHAGMAVTAAGEVLLLGGNEKALGIGQTFTLERYDPVTHSFKGYGCLDQKRCYSNTLEMDSGHVVISGNWYADDCVELYDGSRQCQYVKPVSQHRSMPHMLRTAADNAIIFSARDIHADDFDTIIIDRLHGEPFTVELFETWRPLYYPIGYHGACFIGDEASGSYVNLMQVVYRDSLMGIAKVEGETFTLLPTTCLLPLQGVIFISHILADRSIGRAYVMCYGKSSLIDADSSRIFVAAIDYLKNPAPVTLFYSEPIDSVGICQPVLTDSGDLMVAGGMYSNNYDATSTVLLLHVATGYAASSQAEGRLFPWRWIVSALLLLAAVIATLLWRRSRKKEISAHQEQDVPSEDDDRSRAEVAPGHHGESIADEELLQRICRYMEEERPYLNSELKVQDVAEALGTNRTYISNSIRTAHGCSFSQYVNACRISYAQELLRQHPDKKISEVWMTSGFSTESTFFRAFKDVTGTTPKEWMAGESGKLRN